MLIHHIILCLTKQVPLALQTLRRHFDWFNYAGDILAQFLPPCSGPGTPNGPWSGCSAQAHDHGHSIYLIKQGIIHNTRLASSSRGTNRDVRTPLRKSPPFKPEAAPRSTARNGWTSTEHG